MHGLQVARAVNPLWVHACAGVGSAVCDAVRRALQAQGVDTALARCSADAPHGLLLFNQIDTDTHTTLRDLSAGGDTRIIALHCGEQTLPGAAFWSLLASGAAEVLAWSLSADTPALIAARLQRWWQVDAWLASDVVRQNLVGDSPVWKRTLRQLVEVACFSHAGLLIIGESGTGKELAARLVHTLDARSHKQPLVVLDCSTVMPELAGSEFFGHERGAFTGAANPRDGAFALANGGTLFLDEIGELPLALQPQLLRVIQERSYKRLGGSTWSQTEFRLVCATHRELETEVARGVFRSDLYYRIATCVLRLPPLRERPEDIVPLARRFLAELRPAAPVPELQPPVRDYLMQRPFHGNVRELRQLMARIASRHVGEGPITVGDIPEDERPLASAPATDWRQPELDAAIRRALALGVGLRDISACAADVAIRIAVGEEDGNLQRAARRLGVTDRALQMRRASMAEVRADVRADH